MARKNPISILKWLLIPSAFLVCLFLGFAHWLGIWRIIFPSTHHDQVAPTLPKSLLSPSVMVFSKTNQFRHEESIRAGQQFFERAANENNWGIFVTENGAIFNTQQLANFDVVVFLNTTGDVLNSHQKKAFESWLTAGGGWLGIHAAGDGSHEEWDWYVTNLIGVQFTAHTMGPQFQVAQVMTEHADHPVNTDLPSQWSHQEEWYAWKSSPRGKGFNVLATVDEKSYSPEVHFLGLDRDLRMGDHPIVWSTCLGGGRAIYSALGHQPSAFDSPPHQRLLTNALAWLATGRCEQATQ